MEQPPRQITAIQAAATLTSTNIGVGVLALPLFTVQAANSGAPLVTLLGFLLAFVGFVPLVLLGMRFPSQSFVQYSEAIIGKWPSWIGSACVIAFFAVLTAFTSREFGEVVITAVLTRTPVEVTVIVMLLLAAISTRKDITTFAYIHHFYFPLLLVPVLLIGGLSLKNADVINLLPVWGNQPTYMLEGILTTAALFEGSFVMAVVIPAMKRPDYAMKANFWGMLVGGALYVMIVVATVSVFGSEETSNLLWPTLELAKATSLPANVLERLDAAFLAVWVTTVFTSLLSSYFLTITELQKLFRQREHKMFSLFMLPFVFFIAMLPQNISQMYGTIKIVGRIGLIVTIVYPTLLLVIAIIRNKRGERADAQQMGKND
jgi:spore germination protein